MNLGSIFSEKRMLGWGIRIGAPILVSKIGSLFHDYVWVYAKKLAGLDDFLEEKSGIDLFPPEFQENYDRIINYAIEFTEAAFTDPVKIRFILNRILRNKAPITPEELENYAGMTWQEFLKNLPENLKFIISEDKEDAAVELIQGMLEKFLKIKAPEDKLRASIRNVVAAKNENEKRVKEIINEDSLSGTWARLTKDSQERKKALTDG